MTLKTFNKLKKKKKKKERGRESKELFAALQSATTNSFSQQACFVHLYVSFKSPVLSSVIHVLLCSHHPLSDACNAVINQYMEQRKIYPGMFLPYHNSFPCSADPKVHA